MAKQSITKLVTDSQLTQLERVCDKGFKGMDENDAILINAIVTDFIVSAERGIPLTPSKTDRIKISEKITYVDFGGNYNKQTV